MKNEIFSSLQLITVRWWNATAYYAVNLAQALHYAGYPVVLAGSAGSPPLENAGSINISTFKDIRLDSKNLRELYRSYKNLQNLIGSKNIQILNAHRPEDHLFGGIYRYRHSGVPLVRTVGDVRPPKNNPVNRWLHLKATDTFVFSCRANKERYLSVWPIPDEKCNVIYASVDTTFFKASANRHELRKKLGIGPEEIVFGVVGRFSPVKDHLTFIRAAAQLSIQVKNARFIISGQDVEFSRADLVALAHEWNIYEKFIILGKQEDVRDIVNCIDVGIVCSKGSEAICRIATEYLSMSTPVIVTDVNVLPEMIDDGIDGFIVPAEMPDLLAKKMSIFTASPELIFRMGKNARLSAEKNFNQDLMLQKTLSVYRKVLNKG